MKAKEAGTEEAIRNMRATRPRLVRRSRSLKISDGDLSIELFKTAMAVCDYD